MGKLLLFCTVHFCIENVPRNDNGKSGDAAQYWKTGNSINLKNVWLNNSNNFLLMATPSFTRGCCRTLSHAAEALTAVSTLPVSYTYINRDDGSLETRETLHKRRMSARTNLKEGYCVGWHVIAVEV
jgi:hypothetical protein